MSATLTKLPNCEHSLIIDGCSGGVKKWNLRGNESLNSYIEGGVVIPYGSFTPTDLQVFCIKSNPVQSCAIIGKAIQCCRDLVEGFFPIGGISANGRDDANLRRFVKIFKGKNTQISIVQICNNGTIKWKDLKTGTVLVTGFNAISNINGVPPPVTASPFVSPTVSQDYEIECSYPNADPCSFTFHVEVAEICEKFVITAPKTKVTIGSFLDLTADTVCPTASIQWSTGVTDNGKRTITVNPLTTTTYTATCTTLKNSLGVSCPATSFTLEVGVDCEKFLLTARDELIQSGSSTVLTVTGCPAPAVLSWNTGQTTSTITVLPTEFTKYTATCTLGTSVCTKDVTIKVNIPGTGSDCYAFKVDASATSVAQGSSVILTASGFTVNPVTWNYSLGTGATKTVTPLDNTTYTASTFILRDNANRVCTSSVTVSVSGCNFAANAKPATVTSGAKSTLSAVGWVKLKERT